MAPRLSVNWHLKQIVTDKLINLDVTGNMVGRNSTAKVCLRSNKTSRAHAQLTIDPHRNLMIFDLKSTNGTFVNGQQVPIIGKQVRSGDTISFGLATINLSEDLRDKECFFQVIQVKQAKHVLPEAADSTTNEFDKSVIPIEIDDSSEEFSKDIPHASTPIELSLQSQNANLQPKTITPDIQPMESLNKLKQIEKSELRPGVDSLSSKSPKKTNANPERLSARIASRRLTVSLDRASQEPNSRKSSTKFTDRDFDNILIEINADVLTSGLDSDMVQPATSNQNNNCKLDSAKEKNKKKDVSNVLNVYQCTEKDIAQEGEPVDTICKNETTTLKTFSTNDENSCILIDLTNDNDDNMDISSSQIFQMSQIAKSDVQDDKYQQIKHELAEMDFCTDEVILNHVPINLEDNEEESGFQNTQDIWELLEESVQQTDKEPQVNEAVAEEITFSPEIDFSGNGAPNSFPSKSNSSTEVQLEGSSKDSCNLNINKSDEKRKKYDKLEIIEAHTIMPPIKAQKRSLKNSDKAATKRKTSIESPVKPKKAKSLNSLNPLSCDKKDIQVELKKRRSPLKGTIDKAAKQNILEDRRKKLRELSSPKNTDNDKASAKMPSTSKQKLNIDQHITNPSTPVKKRIARSGSTQTTADVQNNTSFGKIEPAPVLREPPTVGYSGYDLRRTKSSDEIKLRRENFAQNMQQNAANIVRRSTGVIMGNTNSNADQMTLPCAVRPQTAKDSRNDPRSKQQQRVTLKTSYSASVNPNQDTARRLMWTNGGPGRKPAPRQLPKVDDVTKKMVQWLPNWLLEQVDVDASPPINNPPAMKVPLLFRNFVHYYETFSKLILLEIWQYLFNRFRETTEQPRKVKIDHMRVANDLIILDCTCYITKSELNQELFYRADDFLMLECAMTSGNSSYAYLNFGFIQSCRKTTLTNNSNISVKRDLCGDPHTKLEFTVVTRYQPDKEINTKKLPIIKVLSNLRTYLMLIRTVKGLADSPLCPMIVNPQISDFKFTTTHQHLKHKNHLNAEQKTVVLEAASLCTGNKPGIFCVKGPPGTGKSTVIANLVFQIIFSYYFEPNTKPPMILLVAPSNTAVDNLISKMMSLKHELSPDMKTKIKCVRIGPESSINKDVIGYSLPKLAEKHMPMKHHDNSEIWAGKQKGQNVIECLKAYFGDQYYHELKMCENIIIEKSNIICTTLNSCINGRLIDAVNRGLTQFTCCIVDEATQCHEVEALLPTLLGIDKFVLVGDPQQLSATIMNRDASKLGFDQSLFSRLANRFGNDPRSPIKMLTEQYRMHSEICSFPNRQFYEGKLRSLAHPSNKLPDQIKPYLVFNLEWANHSKEYTNMGEIVIIKKILSSILSLVDKSFNYSIGIITPYRAQKDLICDNIRDLETANTNCKIITNTVDSFQGSENDVIIISCVRESSNSFLQNECRLNVALTRAKQALYIIGNYTLFKECRPLYDLREDAKKRRVLLDIRQDPQSITNFDRYLLKKRNNRSTVT